MATITLTLPSAGAQINAGLHSANYAAIQAAINGGLDAANLAANAVGTSELQDASVTAAKLAPGAGGGPGDPVTSLPGSPVDKQQALLVDSLTAPTYAWLFQYESGISDANKWIFLGGSPFVHRIDTSEPSATTGAEYNLATVGPQFTIPRSGIYLVEQAASGGGTVAGNIYLRLAANGDVGTLGTMGLAYTAASPDNDTVSSIIRVTGLVAGNILRMRYYHDAGTVNWSYRVMSVIPVRVA